MIEARFPIEQRIGLAHTASILHRYSMRRSTYTRYTTMVFCGVTYELHVHFI